MITNDKFLCSQYEMGQVQRLIWNVVLLLPCTSIYLKVEDSSKGLGCAFRNVWCTVSGCLWIVCSNKKLMKYKKESNHSLMSTRALFQVVLHEAIYLKSCSFPGFHCTVHVAGPKWRGNSTSEMHPTKRHPQHSKYSGILFTFNIN